MTTANTTIACRRLAAAYGIAPLESTLLRPLEAQGFADRWTAAHPDDAVTKRFDDCPEGFWYITLEGAKGWMYMLSPATRDRLLRRETLMGWFVDESDDEETQDADGDFCSTPGSTGFDSLEDILADLEHCSRAGLLMLEVPPAE